jgi:hypothetical protein
LPPVPVSLSSGMFLFMHTHMCVVSSMSFAKRWMRSTNDVPCATWSANHHRVIWVTVIFETIAMSSTFNLPRFQLCFRSAKKFKIYVVFCRFSKNTSVCRGKQKKWKNKYH